jgi:hypothetical protein
MPKLSLWSRICGRPTGAGAAARAALHRMRHALSGEGKGTAYSLRSRVAGYAVAAGIIQRRGLTRVSGSLRGLVRLAGTVRVGDAELITRLTRKVDHLVVVHPAFFARRQENVTKRDLLQSSCRPLHCIPQFEHSSFLDAGVDSKGALLTSRQQSSRWALIINSTHEPVAHNNVDCAKTSRREQNASFRSVDCGESNGH